MKLVDLHPHWYGAGGEGISDADGNPVPERHGIGILFDCPCGCGEQVGVAFDRPLDGQPPLHSERATWQRTGDTFETLTLRPSILRGSGCHWHGFVTDGEVTTC